MLVPTSWGVRAWAWMAAGSGRTAVKKASMRPNWARERSMAKDQPLVGAVRTTTWLPVAALTARGGPAQGSSTVRMPPPEQAERRETAAMLDRRGTRSRASGARRTTGARRIVNPLRWKGRGRRYRIGSRVGGLRGCGMEWLAKERLVSVVEMSIKRVRERPHEVILAALAMVLLAVGVWSCQTAPMGGRGRSMAGDQAPTSEPDVRVRIKQGVPEVA